MASEAEKAGLLDAAWSWLQGLSQEDVQSGADALATATAFVPGVGDAMGLSADLNRMIQNPEERTWGNAGVAALGAIPFIPSLGMIRSMGREDLMPWHGTDRINLSVLLDDGGELYSPSLGISQGTIPSQWVGGQNELALIPKVGAFDPSTYPTTLFNRDAYTPRKNAYEGFLDKSDMGHMDNLQEALDGGETMESIRRYGAQLRNADRFSPDRAGTKIRGREQYGTMVTDFKEPATLSHIAARLGSVPHAAAIEGSPAFRNFEKYEKSPLGAKLLEPSPEAAQGYVAFNNNLIKKQFGDLPPSVMREIPNMLVNYDHARGLAGGREGLLEVLIQNPQERLAMSSSPEIATMLRDDPEKFLKGLDNYRRDLVKAPSEYAELKVSGPAQVNSEHFAGAIFPQLPGLQASRSVK